MTQAYPLHWPEGWARTAVQRRSKAAFSTPLEKAYRELANEIRLWGGKHIVVSTNAEQRRDGLPKIRQQPIDPGVAVWFLWRGKQRCIPCDRWNRIQDNMNAIRHTVAAMRGIERWGTGEMLNRTAHVFDALPPPRSSRPWHDVLGVARTASKDEIDRAYRAKAREAHPDQGGSVQAMQALNAAREEALGAQAS